jgi:hypothetical protein
MIRVEINKRSATHWPRECLFGKNCYNYAMVNELFYTR